MLKNEFKVFLFSLKNATESLKSSTQVGFDFQFCQKQLALINNTGPS